MSTVRIPPVLRASAGGEKQVEIDGSTIGEVLTALVGRYPALGSQLLTEDGELNRFVNVYVDGQDVRYLQAGSTPVAAADTIIILPAMAGGSGAPLGGCGAAVGGPGAARAVSRAAAG